MTTSASSTDTSHRKLGPFCILAGAVAMWIARDYDAGTFIAMGPGFFPIAISGALIVLGVAVLIGGGRDLPADDAPAESETTLSLAGHLRIIGFITLSIVVFGLTLSPLGLPVASFLMVVLASLVRKSYGIGTTLATAVALAVFATLLFPLALGLQIPVLPEFLR